MKGQGPWSAGHRAWVFGMFDVFQRPNINHAALTSVPTFPDTLYQNPAYTEVSRRPVPNPGVSRRHVPNPGVSGQSVPNPDVSRQYAPNPDVSRRQ